LWAGGRYNAALWNIPARLSIFLDEFLSKVAYLWDSPIYFPIIFLKEEILLKIRKGFYG